MPSVLDAVWVAAVGLFFHRWGKIRMLLPYQPVFKEEEPVIVAACSPSPTLQRMMSSSSQDQQQQMGMGCSQQSSPSPAVLVSANKFVSLDPAAIRRNQFKVRLLGLCIFRPLIHHSQTLSKLALLLCLLLLLLLPHSNALTAPAGNIEWVTMEPFFITLSAPTSAQR